PISDFGFFASWKRHQTGKQTSVQNPKSKIENPKSKMPELPEVETMKRGIAAVVGCRIRGVVRPKCRLRPIQISPDFAGLRRRATGRTIAGLDRIGKRVVIRLDHPRGAGGDS